MTYNPINFNNGKAGGTPVSASNLRHVENGIVAAHNDIAALTANVNSLSERYGTPLVAHTAAEMTDNTKIYVYVGSETGYTTGNWYYYDGDSWESGGAYNSTAVNTDKTLTQEDMAADAKKVGDELSDLKSAIQSLSSIPTAVKQAMDTLFQNVAFKDDNEYRSELNVFHAWASEASLVSISAVFTQTKPYYAYDILDRLKDDLVVTATYSDSSTAVVSDYVLSGTLAVGTSTVSVTFAGKTASFNVTVSNGFYYAPSMGLLSEQEFVTAEVVGNITPSGITETIVDDYLRFYTPKTASSSYWEYLQMETPPANISTYGRYKLEFKAVNAGYIQQSNTNTKGNVFMTLISTNNTGGLFGFVRSASNGNPIKLRYTNSTACSWGMDISTDIWHTAELIIENGTQTLKVDDTVVLENAALGTGGIATGYTNRIVINASATNEVEVHIKSFEFEVQ